VDPLLDAPGRGAPARQRGVRWRSRRVLFGAGVVLAVGTGSAIAGILPVAPAAWAAPAVVVSPPAVAPGGSVTVAVTGLAPDTNYRIQVCGAGGLAGSAGCDVGDAQIVPSSSQGALGAALVVHVPPVACPCVVQVAPVEGGASAQAPLQILGAPVGPVTAPGASQGTVSVNVELEGSSSWGEWFGAAPRRTAVVVVTNRTGSTFVDPVVVVSVGNQPVSSPALGTVRSGASATVRVPVAFPWPAVGWRTVQVTLGATGQSVATGSTRALFVPWGLVAVAALVVQLLLLGLRNRARRRLEHRARASVPGSVAGSGVGHELAGLERERAHVDADPPAAGGRGAGAGEVVHH